MFALSNLFVVDVMVYMKFGLISSNEYGEHFNILGRKFIVRKIGEDFLEVFTNEKIYSSRNYDIDRNKIFVKDVCNITQYCNAQDRENGRVGYDRLKEIYQSINELNKEKNILEDVYKHLGKKMK